MDKHAVSAVIVLLLLVAVQAHTLDRRETSSSSSGTGSSILNVTSSRTIVDVGDPALNAAVDPRSSEGSSSSHGTRNTERTASPSTSSSNALAAVESPFSSSPPELLSSSPNDTSVARYAATHFGGDSTASSSSSHGTGIVGDSSYTAGTVKPNEERLIVESTALELSTVDSTSPEQVEDAAVTSSPSTSTHSTTTSGKEATSTTDRTTSSPQGGNGTDVATSGATVSSPIFYACLVVGVAGLVGAVLAYSIEWRVVSKACPVTPPMSPDTWAPPPSEVHVVIDDRNFAIL